MTELGSLNDHTALQVKDVLLAEYIESSRAPGEMLVEKRIIVRAPGNLGHVEITGNAERSADPLKFFLLDWCLRNLSTDMLKRIRVLTETVKRPPRFLNLSLSVQSQFTFHSTPHPHLPLPNSPSPPVPTFPSP